MTLALRGENHGDALRYLADLERLGRGAAKGLDGPGLGGSLSSRGDGERWGLRLPGAGYDYEAAAGDLARNSAVAICLAWLADNFPEPEFRVVRDLPDGSEQVVVDHPLPRLLRRPNPGHGWHGLAKGLVASYRVDGNAFWGVACDATGEPAQLWWLDHTRIKPRWHPGNYLDWWDFEVAGMRPQRLDTIDGANPKIGTPRVLHFRDGIDPSRDRLGTSALRSCLREVCTDNEAGTYTAAVLRNLGIVGYLLQPANPNDSFGSKDERDEIADSFQAGIVGENRGRPMVANAAIKADRVGMSPEELALDRILRVPESRITAACRINAMVAGLAVGAEMRTFSNYAESRKAAYEDGIVPLQKEVAWVITTRLLPLFRGSEGLRFEFDYRNVACLSEGQDAKFRRYGDAYQTDRLLTLNQALKGLGYDAVDGGDRFADGSGLAPTPSAEPSAAAGAVAVSSGDVQAAALNGAQIASMVAIVAQVVAGQLPIDSARALILAAFPTLDATAVAAIIDPARAFRPTPPSGDAGDDAAKALLADAARIMGQAKALLPRGAP